MESAHDMGLSGASAMGHAVGEVASHGLGLGSQAASSMTSNVGSAFSADSEGTTGGKVTKRHSGFERWSDGGLAG